jgi:hypothetical protein
MSQLDKSLAFNEIVSPLENLKMILALFLKETPIPSILNREAYMKRSFSANALFLLGAFLLTHLFALNVFAEETKRPNFIIFYTDDQGYGDTSVPMIKDRPELAKELYKTPHLERLVPADDPKRVFSLTKKSVEFINTQAKAQKPFLPHGFPLCRSCSPRCT